MSLSTLVELRDSNGLFTLSSVSSMDKSPFRDYSLHPRYWVYVDRHETCFRNLGRSCFQFRFVSREHF
ncbi:hypothetical protein Hanom_Chr09g00806361 [Helianthus anomalus]